jgi:hypothetical protein
MRFGSYFLLKKYLKLPVLSEKQANMLTNDQQINNDYIVLSNEQSNYADITYNDFLEIIKKIDTFEDLEEKLRLLRLNIKIMKTRVKKGTEDTKKKYEDMVIKYADMFKEYNDMNVYFQGIGKKYLVDNIYIDKIKKKIINNNISLIFAFRRLVGDDFQGAKLLLIYLIKQTTISNRFTDEDLLDAIESSNRFTDEDLLDAIESSNSEDYITDWFFDLLWINHRE